MKKNKRIEIIDILRGFTILSVILGHSIQRGIGAGFEENLIYKFIFTYSMPLFMVLSGFTLYLSSKAYDKNFIISRFKRLIIPTITFSYIFYFIKDFWFVGINNFIDIPDSFSDFTINFIRRPDFIIWFLFIVFIFNVIFWMGKNLMPDRYFKFFLIVTAIAIYLLQDYFGLYRLKLYLPLFIGGYLLAEHRDSIFKYSKYALIPSLLYWVSFAHLWSASIPIWFQHLLAVSGMIAIYYFFRNFNFEPLNELLTHFGRYSLEYYLCHILFLNIGIGDGFLRIVTIFISSVVISTLLIKVIKSNKYADAIFFGNFQLNKSQQKAKVI